MSTRPQPPASVPTLTEVVSWPEDDDDERRITRPVAPLPEAAAQKPAAPVPAPAAVTAPVSPAEPPAPPPPAPPPPAPPPPVAPPPVAPITALAQSTQTKPASLAAVSEREVAQRLLEGLSRQLDLMLEVRLREALAPVLARATDSLVRDARKEMTAALREAVARAVEAELSRKPR